MLHGTLVHLFYTVCLHLFHVDVFDYWLVTFGWIHSPTFIACLLTGAVQERLPH